MIRVTTWFAFFCISLMASAGTPSAANEQPSARRYESHPGHPGKHRYRQNPAPSQSYYQNGWYQRPYPYHLDYYRMRYGGSYAPYFGNLYGPPRIYNFGPVSPFYGGAYFW